MCKYCTMFYHVHVKTVNLHVYVTDFDIPNKIFFKNVIGNINMHGIFFFNSPLNIECIRIKKGMYLTESKCFENCFYEF